MDGGTSKDNKPLVVITGAAGNIGTALTRALQKDYTIVGLDTNTESDLCEIIEIDLTQDASVELALKTLQENHGKQIASVIHLAAYFDFSGKERDLYREVNEDGTRRLLQGLQAFNVAQFIYSSTMLVHAPIHPGEVIDEDSPLGPGWAYPKSKARTEKVIKETAGNIPYVLLRLAGLYDSESAVPTLSQQIARIYERDLKSYVYSGDLNAGQAFLHRDDMIDAFKRTVDRRDRIDSGTAILIGEPYGLGYQALQTRIGELIHGADEWATLVAPGPAAKLGAWVETKAEPIIPDAYDEGEKPFIRPFMIDMASDHYALDTSRARDVLGWTPDHNIEDGLAALVAALKEDPPGWYEGNGIHQPPWMVAAAERGRDAEDIRAAHELKYRKAHQSNLWAHWANMALAFWLLTSPPLLGYAGTWMAWGDYVTGALLVPFSFLAMSWRLSWARFACALIGVCLLMVPLVTWTDSGAAYLNATICGILIISFAIALPPAPGVSATADQTGPMVPKGWDYNPSSWLQRIPLIVLALVGLLGSRYMTAHQLEAIPGVWDPFFSGMPGDGKNGTEEVITSDVSKAWPIPDAGIGAVTYALEIIVGLIGAQNRWRTMPWLTLLFGLMIVPLGAISIFFIIIQPILIGTYCTLCLLLAAAMLVQIPYSVDELVATCQFLRRRKNEGQPWLRVFLTGDTDEGATSHQGDDFEQAPTVLIKDMLTGGLQVTWPLAGMAIVSIWLMLAPWAIGASGGMASVNHIVGALALTVTITAVATVARAFRLVNIMLGLVLLAAPFFYDTPLLILANSAICGLALVALSIPRGPVRSSYGTWDRMIF
ncbi:DNA polymerase 3, epsilon subunit [Sulfitobacter noctilucae]|nr:DNA polymerase 3, epsilon subunit [Sulfitobacter noctilucae]